MFLREFGDVRRDPAVQLAPVVSFSKNVPMELEGVAVEEGEGVCYISFALFKRHLDDKAEASVSAICQFRNYLHYHIKCSKVLFAFFLLASQALMLCDHLEPHSDCGQAFMHMRMRKRVDDLLTVLNRAKLPAEAAVEKKAWGGRSITK